MPIQDILEPITVPVTPDQSFLIGVDGDTGSGKSTFTHWLTEPMLYECWDRPVGVFFAQDKGSDKAYGATEIRGRWLFESF